MARGAANFRQSDLAKALKAAKQAGLAVTSVEIGKDGNFRLVSGPSLPPADATTETPDDLRGKL